MPDFILYLIKANLAILLFYAGYRLLLRRLTFYNLNRFYLLFAIVFSAGYPLINMDEVWSQHNPLPPAAAIVMTNWQQIPEASFSMWPYVQAILFLIAAVLGIRLLFRLASLRKIHVSSIPAVWQVYRYFQTEVNVSPFSFFKHIYIHPPRHEEGELREIFEHEQVHANQLHSIDVLLAELCSIAFWFNPLAWGVRHAIRENLEFITDRRVLQKGLDAKSYQYNLLKNLTQAQPQLANNFNFKNLKNRIMMMNKKRSSRFQLGKYFLLLPLIVIFVSAFTIRRAYQQVDISTVQDTALVKGKVVLDAAPADTTRTKGDATIHIKTADGKKPLYVVDGVVATGGFNGIKTEDIESISILKDSSATRLWGSKGKNGVIMVTTKKGSGASDSTQLQEKAIREGVDYMPTKF